MESRRGGVLVFVLVTMVMMAGAVAVVLGTTVVQARVSRETDWYVRAFHGANAALEYVRYYVRASRYAANGRNEWLVNHSSDAGYALTSADCPEMAALGATATVTSYAGTHWYRIESRVPAGSLGVDRIVEVWAREREPFSEYMFFRGKSFSFGETTVKGKVHCNGTITFSDPCRNPGTNEPAKFWGETTATGVSGLTSAQREELFRIYNDDGTVRYVSNHQFNVQTRPMPQTNDIDSLYGTGSAEGYVANSSVEFITAWDASAGKYVTKVKLDGGAERALPAGGVIAGNSSNVVITGRMTSQAGTVYNVAAVNGRVTIVNKDANPGSKISISSPIIYIDGAGEPYFQHKDGSGNCYDYRTANYFDDTGKDLWVNNEFARNPGYTGNSAVGIVAAEDVRYGVNTAARTSLEIDAAIIANNGFGYWHDGLVKRNLRIVGSLTSDSTYGRYSQPEVTGSGYSYSGIYQYDDMLRGNSPPYFLGTARPEFFAWRVIR